MNSVNMKGMGLTAQESISLLWIHTVVPSGLFVSLAQQTRVPVFNSEEASKQLQVVEWLPVDILPLKWLLSATCYLLI